MELHRIGDGQLRISLSVEDMNRYELTNENMDYDDTATRRAFWSILDQAKKQTGFDAARDRVLIQAFPKRSGGCEMYVTRVGSKEEERGCAPAAEQAGGTKSRQAVHTSATLQRQTVYAFEHLDDLLFCCVLLRECYRAKSESWFEPLRGGGRYYLILWECTAPDRPEEGYLFLSEFGHRCDRVSMPYLREHARRIAAPDAVMQLAQLHKDVQTEHKNDRAGRKKKGKRATIAAGTPGM